MADDLTERLRTFSRHPQENYERPCLCHSCEERREAADRIDQLEAEMATDKRLDLSGADLRGADMRDAYMRKADMRQADMSDAYLRWADMNGADMKGANLRGTNLYEAHLHGANLYGAHLYGAYMGGAEWDEHTVWPDGIGPLPKEGNNDG